MFKLASNKAIGSLSFFYAHAWHRAAISATGLQDPAYKSRKCMHVFLCCTAELGLSVSVGGSECLLRPPSRNLHPGTEHTFPGPTWENQDLWLPEPLHTRRRSQRSAEVLPQQVYSGVDPSWLRITSFLYPLVFFSLLFLIWCWICLQVYVDQLTSEDMQFIGNSIFPNINEQIISKMVQFSNKVRLK